MKIPNIIATKIDLRGRCLRENGNNQTTGQQGAIPFIFSQSGDAIIKNGKHIAVKNTNIFFLFFNIIFQHLDPIYRLW